MIEYLVALTQRTKDGGNVASPSPSPLATVYICPPLSSFMVKGSARQEEMKYGCRKKGIDGERK
jgi:hypothetical protein